MKSRHGRATAVLDNLEVAPGRQAGMVPYQGHIGINNRSILSWKRHPTPAGITTKGSWTTKT
uniref:Transposase n=1 Tax=Macrostomum lignano TaxID=282301 RepID=A0A1I8IUM0_9PLAT